VIEGVLIMKAVYVSNNPLLDPVRIIITLEIEVGRTLIIVHVAQETIDIIKLLITVHAAIKHRRALTSATISPIETICSVLTTIPFADVFPKIPLTLVLDNFKIEHPITSNIVKLLILVPDHVQQETTTINATIEPDET
jgi:hypothetical protein